LVNRALRDFSVGNIRFENIAFHADLTADELAWFEGKIFAGDSAKMCEELAKMFLREVRGQGVRS